MIIFDILWIATILIGSVFKNKIPDDWVYTYGFIFGCLSMFWLDIKRIFKEH